MQDIKYYKYFISKLKSISKEISEYNMQTIRDRETKQKIDDLIEELEDFSLKINGDLFYYYQSNLMNIINELEEEIKFNKSLEKPIKTDFKPYQEKAYSKLNYLFRKNQKLNKNEAFVKYENFKELSDKFEVFIELINWLNDNNIVIIPEKTLFSAFLGITVEIYNDLLANSKNEEVKNLFKNIDEYFTTQQFGALINNDRKSLERIQKLKSYGQEMMQTQPDVLKITNNNQVISFSDIMQKIESKRRNIIDYDYNDKEGD